MMLSAHVARLRGAIAALPRPRTVASVVFCGMLLCTWSEKTAAAALLCQVAPCPVHDLTQQGAKLVGTGNDGSVVWQGASVALSADGSTAIVGAPYDDWNGNGSGDGGVGAAWVFTRSGTVWTQQQKLAGTGYTGNPGQGWSVALSGDGNTAIVGGSGNNEGSGAVWIFTRSNGVWSQQAGPLIGSGANNGDDGSHQGASVALSSDGNTAIVGAPFDQSPSESYAGAAWVWTRSGTTWTQQGSKLTASDYSTSGSFGYSVALSSDGNTAVVGGAGDDSSGAIYVFTRSSGVWTEQAGPLIGSNAIGDAEQGFSVALSADGNTAIEGGRADDSYIGAVWVWTRNGSTWTQQGRKLIGTGWRPESTSPDYLGASFGGSIALSSDGNTAVVGGWGDNGATGAVWVFTRSGSFWTQQGSKLVGTGAVGRAFQAMSLAISSDGSTAIEGGYQDNSAMGAAWVFVAHDLTAAPFSGAAPLAVSFLASNLNLPLTYTLNFGDGTQGALSRGPCSGMPPGLRCSGSASHTYTSAGTYTATLLDASGGTVGSVTITAAK